MRRDYPTIAKWSRVRHINRTDEAVVLVHRTEDTARNSR
jgi:hypothetical protein